MRVWKESTVGKREGYLLAKRYEKRSRNPSWFIATYCRLPSKISARAFQAFFRLRVKAGEEPGYPRFYELANGWRSIGFKQYRNGFKVDDRRFEGVRCGTYPCTLAQSLSRQNQDLPHCSESRTLVCQSDV